jgi:DNA polymerase-3 subunit delta
MLNAVKRGFPKHHHLLLTAEAVDKRTSLYKAIKSGGVVIDCSVAKGTRKKDREAQQQLIYGQAKEMLAAAGKKMAPKAFEAIYQLIGFDLHAFSRAIEKLISYTGTKANIDIEDIQAVLTKSREEPIYELTGAISDRNSMESLRILSELLGSGYHYLQILMAITNQVRRLILVKGFIASEAGSRWQSGTSYDQFKNVVMPTIQSYDKKLVEKIDRWAGETSKDGAGSQRNRKPVTEQLIARQPNNPYPVFQQFRKADNFSLSELRHALNRLQQADVALKTTGRVPELVLQELIISICGKSY